MYDAMNIASWKEVHLKELLEEKFGLPVAVNNDSNCFALGESLLEAGDFMKIWWVLLSVPE